MNYQITQRRNRRIGSALLKEIEGRFTPKRCKFSTGSKSLPGVAKLYTRLRRDNTPQLPTLSKSIVAGSGTALI